MDVDEATDNTIDSVRFSITYEHRIMLTDRLTVVITETLIGEPDVHVGPLVQQIYGTDEEIWQWICTYFVVDSLGRQNTLSAAVGRIYSNEERCAYTATVFPPRQIVCRQLVYWHRPLWICFDSVIDLGTARSRRIRVNTQLFAPPDRPDAHAFRSWED